MEHDKSHMKPTYAQFGLMIGIATLAMFGMMYLNTYALDHVWFSQTRAWMAVLMGAGMAIIMLGFMHKMYQSSAVNAGIVVGSLGLFLLSLWLVRTQETVDDVSYMKAKIPHHSIAIMTSMRAHIRDERVRMLADGIIRAQVKDIGEMKQLISEIEKNPTPDRAPDLAPKSLK